MHSLQAASSRYFSANTACADGMFMVNAPRHNNAQ